MNGSAKRAALHNEEIAAAFEEMGDLLAILGENAFRVRAYQRAAQIIRSLPRPLADMHGPAEWDALPGIGTDLAAKIGELLTRGRLKALDKLRRRVPPGVRELLKLPGLGPVRVRALFTQLQVRDAADLRRAIAEGRLAGLRGFGPKLRARLQQALTERPGEAAGRIPRSVAEPFAAPLKAYLEAVPGVLRVDIAGSYRRGRDTLGDLDVLVCAAREAAPIRALKGYPELRTLDAAGSTKASATLRSGLKVDVRVVPAESYGAALHYFTGSRDHSIRLRRRAQERGLRLSEYGLYRGERRIAGRTEEELFEALGLPWIPPELREDRGEIEAAERHALPHLIELEDLRGDCHVHTDASDGVDSLEQMVAAARARGLDYIAVADHSRHLGVTHGQDAGRLSRQIDAIDALNATLTGFTVLKGAEVDILGDGSLALPERVLRRLDLVVVAVHTQFGLSEARQTARLLRALDRPCVSILAHPFGRLLGERPAYALDFERLLTAVQERGCFLELNSQPLRLDLDDVHARAARERGIPICINSDAHSAQQLGFLEHGVRQARRAWLERKDVLNARPLRTVRTLLRRTLR